MRACAGINEDPFALQYLSVELQFMRRQKAAVSTIETNARMAGEIAFLTVAPLLHDGFFSIHHGRKIHIYRTGAHSPTRRIPRVVGHLCGGNHGFGGCTAGVDAGAAQVRLLDESNGPAVLGKGIAERITSLSGANHDGIVFFHVKISAPLWDLRNEPNRPCSWPGSPRGPA